MDSNQPTLEQSQQQPILTPAKKEKQGYRVNYFSLVLAIILLVVAGVTWYYGTATTREYQAKYGNYSGTVTGERVDIPFCGSESESGCSIQYKYEVDGKEYTKKFTGLSGFDILDTENNTIYYNPESPEDAILAPNTLDPDQKIEQFNNKQLLGISEASAILGAMLLISAFVGYYVEQIRLNINEKIHNVASKNIEQIGKKKDDGGTA